MSGGQCLPLVPSLEFCQRLRDAGVAQISFFHYFKNETVADGEFWDCGRLANPGRESVSAFTVCELDIMLGNRWERPRMPQISEITRATDPLSYVNYFPNKAVFYAKMPDAYADLILRLISENLLNVMEVNVRLSRIFPTFIS